MIDNRPSTIVNRKSADPVQSYRKYLEPSVLARIGALELRARLVVEGYFSGLHRSPYRGWSAEFADHRVYTQGDDVRHIDWKLFGRTDKHYIKEYEQETNLHCVLVVDCSESMSYRSASSAMTKHEYSTSLAAALAYLALQQRDSVGLVLFDERITHYVPPSNNPAHWKTIVGDLQGKTGPAKTALRSVLADLADRLKSRSMIVLISDLFDDPDELMTGLHLLRFRRHEIIVCAVWDYAERYFPFERSTLFDGLEATGRLLAHPRTVRERYLEEARSFLERMSRGCRELHIDFAQFDTSSPLDVALSTYLATRSASIRQRSSRVLAGR